jgi:hypothetical protein
MLGEAAQTDELAIIKEQEIALGIPLGYQRDMAMAAPGSSLRLRQIGELARQDQSIPAHVALLAGLGATMAEDCGECVQIYVNLAVQAGVEPRILRAALDNRLVDLPPDLKLGFCFGRVVCENDPMMLEKGAAIEARFGRKGLVDLAMTVALARFYPTLKRALGHSRSCALVEVAIPA